jgi:hypothetical protein
VLVDRLAARTTNDYGKRSEERELILRQLSEIEPLVAIAGDADEESFTDIPRV